ncbi:AraC family transcriptional regulator [Thalassotalea ganghwensis]
MSCYQRRFNQVLSFIEQNLSEPINVEQLCKISHLSKFHFHRLCSNYFGMTVMTLVNLLRLKRAAYQLAYRIEKPVIEIALENGYQSHEGFTRNFKKHFLQSPSQFRRCPNWIAWQQHYQPMITLRSQMMEPDDQFNVEIVNFEQTPIAIMSHKGPQHQLSQTISKFIAWRKKNKLSPNVSRTFNIIYDDPNVTPPEDYRFDLACTYRGSPDVRDENIQFSELPESQCAHIRHTGSDDTLGNAINYLYSHWIVKQQYQLADLPLFIERVSFFPEVAEQDMITDIYLPIC